MKQYSFLIESENLQEGFLDNVKSFWNSIKRGHRYNQRQGNLFDVAANYVPYGDAQEGLRAFGNGTGKTDWLRKIELGAKALNNAKTGLRDIASFRKGGLSGIGGAIRNHIGGWVRNKGIEGAAATARGIQRTLKAWKLKQKRRREMEDPNAIIARQERFAKRRKAINAELGK